jgi:hypothetical protein
MRFYLILGLLVSLLSFAKTTTVPNEYPFHVDVAWEFQDSVGLDGWGNATASEMQMEVRVENDEMRASIVGWEPAIESPPLVLDVTRRHYVVFRMMYYGGADTAQLMLKSGASRMDRDRLDWSRSYWSFRLRHPKVYAQSPNSILAHSNMSYAVDGDPKTVWMASIDETSNVYIDLDMEERRWVSAVRLKVPLGTSTPHHCLLQRSRVHSTGPFETVGEFFVANSTKDQYFGEDEGQFFGGINAYGRYWRFRILSTHGASNTAIREIELHGADEDISVAPFEHSNTLDNKGNYKMYYIPIHQFVSGTLLRMRLRMFTAAKQAESDQRVRARAQFREAMAIDYIRVVRAPEIWRVRGCLDAYSETINFDSVNYNVTKKLNVINNNLPLRYFEKREMDLQYARTYDCPTEGGVDIRVDGLNFGEHARVFIGSNADSHTIPKTQYGSGREDDHGRGPECIVKSFKRDPNNGRIESLICTLPPGTPGPKLVRVENGNMPGIFQESPLFSYRVAPPVPKRPNITNIAAHRVDLVWEPPGSELDNMMVTGYKILWFTPTRRSNIHNMTVGNVTTSSVRGLTPDTEYVFAVAAVSEGVHHEKSANLPTDLYGRRKLTGNAMVGAFSAYTNVTATFLWDVDFSFFNANVTTNSGGAKGAKFMSSKGPTGQVGSEGNYGIVLVGSANVQNCNSSSTCCDGYNVTLGAEQDYGCGLVCATILERRLAYDLVVDGVTRRQVPANIPYVKEGDQEKVIMTLQGLKDSMAINGSQGAELPSSRCGPALRLTPSEARQSGSAWYNRKMNVREGFDTTFKFEISNPSIRCDRLDDVNTYCRGRGADGIAFILQDESPMALGDAGKGIGYQGIYNALAVELDTYSNFDNLDPYENHISVTTQGWRANISANHSRSLADTTRIPDLTDGIHSVRIRYDPNFNSEAVPHPSFQTTGYTTFFLENADFANGGEGDWGTGFGLLYVYIDDLYSPVITTPLNLEDTLKMEDGRLYVGLTSGTGDANWQTHDILEWQFRSLYIDRLYEPPVVVNGEGAHECRNESVCVHVPEYDHYMRTNNVWESTIDITD